MPPFPPQYPFPWYADTGDGTWTFFSDVPLPKSSKRNSTTRTGTGTALNPATIFNGTPHSISQSIRLYRFDVDDNARALQDYNAGIANPAKGFPALGSVTDVLENCGPSALVKQAWDPEHGNVRGSNVSLNSHFSNISVLASGASFGLSLSCDLPHCLWGAMSSPKIGGKHGTWCVRIVVYPPSQFVAHNL